MRLIVDRVTHHYGDMLAVEDIVLDVAEGETLGLIGPSGCGKSTLLQIMGGLIRPTGGTVATVGDAPPGCLNLSAYVFQDFALLPWRSVRGNVELVLEQHGLSGAERRGRADEVLALCGLSDFAGAFPKQLSGGMKQRVGIARALAVNPAILFLDEPMSALDAQTVDLLIEDLMAIWQRRRTTAVYVTHNLTEALRVADRVAVLSRRPGRLKAMITVDVPRAERNTPAAGPRLAALREELWQLIRDEARAADREVDDAAA